LGSPGQGNYAAANAFMDALMQYRQSGGLPGLSINWGPWASVGMAARLDKVIQAQMAAKGVQAIPVSRALSMLDLALRRNEPQTVAAAIDWRKFSRQFRTAPAPRILEKLVESGPSSSSVAVQNQDWEGILDKLREAPAADRHGIVLAQVRKTLAATLRLPSAESVGVNQPLGDLGLDSLMAVEVRNVLTSVFACELSSTLIFDYPTANALTSYLLRMVFPEQPVAGDAEKPAVSSTEIDQMLSVLEAMPESDARQHFRRATT